MRFNIKKISDINNSKVQLLISLVIVCVLSFIVTFFTLAFSEAIADLSSPLFSSYFADKALIALNFFPILFVFLLFYFISNRLWLGFLITSLIWIPMSVINKFKLQYRDEPFLFSDIVLFRESLEMAGEYSINLTTGIIFIAIFIVASTLILFFVQNYRFSNRKLQLSMVFTTALLGALTYQNVYISEDVYANVGDTSLINKWSQTQQFQIRGFVYPFINSIGNTLDTEPKDYDEDRARELLLDYDYEDIPSDQKVNIVSIMLESYNDFSKFESIDWNKDPYEYFHKLQDESYHGNLITNVFGGGTINTERSFLTGIYNHPRYIKDTNSYVWYLKEQGYYTEAMHPIYGWFYNRRNTNPYIGFDNFDYYENKYSKHREYFMNDHEFFDHIIEGFESSVQKESPYFNFTVTYQNHGPYNSTPLDEPYVSISKEYDSSEYRLAYNELNHFFDGMYKTNLALEKLIEYFRNCDEPTVVVLFGDHNPMLGENNIGFEMMGINMDLDTVDGAINYYETPYLFWGNPAAQEALGVDFIGEGSDISPNFLMNELFEYVNWKGSEFMQYSSDIKKEVSVFNNIIFKEDDKFVNSLSPDRLTKFSEFRDVEYFYLDNRIYK